MAVRHRKTASQVAQLRLPHLPATAPPDWPPDLYEFLRQLVYALRDQDAVIFAIQNNGTAMPLRAALNFTAGVTLTDDQTNDRTNVSVP